jgi:zinc and cadmium transporter
MVVVFALSTFVSTLVGGLVALRNRDRMHLILGFTAGVLLGLVAFDLLPEVFQLSTSRTAGVPTVMVAFAAGFLALHIVERSVALHGAHEDDYGDHSHHHPTVGLISALALCGHSFMDGLAIGLGFQAGSALGIAVAIAVVAHDFADGLNTVSIMLAHDNSTRRSATLLALDAAAPLLGALATLTFSVSDGTLALYLGFFAGFLLYLATADILPEAHSRHPSQLTLVCTVAGIGLIWVVVAVS